MPPKVSKPRKKRAIRKTKDQPLQIDLLRQGDFEIGFRPNLRPIQQASLLGNLLTNVSNQEKLSALSASLKQYEKQLDESKKSPNVVTVAEELKPLTLASSQVGRLRDIRFMETKEKELGQKEFEKNLQKEQKQFKESFSQEFNIGTTLEQDLDALDRISSATRSALIQQREQLKGAAFEPHIPLMQFGGRSRPTPLATLQRRATPPLPSTSIQIKSADVMEQTRRENLDLRSAQRLPVDQLYD